MQKFLMFSKILLVVCLLSAQVSAATWRDLKNRFTNKRSAEQQQTQPSEALPVAEIDPDIVKKDPNEMLQEVLKIANPDNSKKWNEAPNGTATRLFTEGKGKDQRIIFDFRDKDGKVQRNTSRHNALGETCTKTEMLESYQVND